MDIPTNGARPGTPRKTLLTAAILVGLVAICLNMEGGFARADDAVRVTTSFDAKYASAVLRQVSKVFSAGFGPTEASRVDQDINAMKPDVPKAWQFSVQYKGKAEQFQIRALMDDLGMIDLDFSAGADAAPAVRAAVDGYLNGRGG